MAILLPEPPNVPNISEERLKNKGAEWLKQGTDRATGQVVFAEYFWWSASEKCHYHLIWYPPVCEGTSWLPIRVKPGEYESLYEWEN